MKRKFTAQLILLVVVLLLTSSPLLAKDSSPPLPVNKKILATIYSGLEFMHYAVSWSGGIKIGDLYLAVVPAENDDGFVITAQVTDYGLFHLFYPLDDTFRTSVRGSLKLPYQYDVLQKEGYGSREIHRQTFYDQRSLQVRYQKNKQPVKEFSLTGTAYNEFSSFYITRSLIFQEQQNQKKIIPTFVDEKRHEVAVLMLGREERDSLFGKVTTLKVMPKMEFEGLYDKDGDTVFWLTDDVCRVPVAINSKILIGSLTAELIEYTNPACLKWSEKLDLEQH
jgi:hypothetical protein